MADALHTPGANVDAREARLDQGGLIASSGASPGVRTGVLVGPNWTALVTGTSATGTMTVNVLAHHWVTSRGTADGPYVGCKEASTTVTIAAAPGTNSRIDVVYVKEQDSASAVSPDGVTGELYGVVTGTAAASPGKPSLPVGAEEIGTVTVAAGATNTLGAGITIANTARGTVARGAPVPVRSQAERDALTKYPALSVIRMDTADYRTETWNGTKWSFWTGGVISGTTDTNGLMFWAHGGSGQAPVSWGLSPGPQTTDAINQVIQLLAFYSDTSNLQLRATRTDGALYLAGNPVTANWWAKF